MPEPASSRHRRGSIRMQHGVDDGSIGRLSLVVGVEDQWVLPKSPGAAVAEAPEGHPLDYVLMLDKDRKQLGIVIRLCFQILRRRRRAAAKPAASESTAFETEAELTARGAADGHVQLRHADLQPQ